MDKLTLWTTEKMNASSANSFVAGDKCLISLIYKSERKETLKWRPVEHQQLSITMQKTDQHVILAISIT